MSAYRYAIAIEVVGCAKGIPTFVYHLYRYIRDAEHGENYPGKPP